MKELYIRHLTMESLVALPLLVPRVTADMVVAVVTAGVEVAMEVELELVAAVMVDYQWELGVVEKEATTVEAEVSAAVVVDLAVVSVVV